MPYGAAGEAGAVSDARAQKIDRAEMGPAFPRTHHVLWLEFGNRQDFDDPRQEWRRLFSELLGTFAPSSPSRGAGAAAARRRRPRDACPCPLGRRCRWNHQTPSKT